MEKSNIQFGAICHFQETVETDRHTQKMCYNPWSPAHTMLQRLIIVGATECLYEEKKLKD